MYLMIYTCVYTNAWCAVLSRPELASYQFPVEDDSSESTTRDMVDLAKQPCVSALKMSSNDPHVRLYTSLWGIPITVLTQQ